jgi:ketosteroid isomerase-like protein
MSQENVEAIAATFAAVQRSDWERAMERVDPAVELDQTRMPDGGVYHGRDALFDFFARWFGAWEDLRFELERIEDLGDSVLLLNRMTGRGRSTGADVSVLAADVFTFRDGKIIRQVGYPDAREALKAVGLEE